MKTAEVRAVFDELKAGLVPLIAEVAERADAVDDSFLTGDFPIDAQKHVEGKILADFGFTADSWRLDETVHPFASRSGMDDIRLTTKHLPDSLSSIFSSMHEFGHGIYEYGGDRAFARTPLARGTSLGFHESQSRMWENLVGRSRPFWQHYYPLVQEAFPVAAERRRRGGLLPRRQPRPAVAHPHRGRRGDVQPPHHPSLRAGAGDDHRPSRRRRRARGVGREDARVPRRRGAGRRRRRAAGHALGRRLDRLLLDVRARQRHVRAALGADLGRHPRRLRADRPRRVRRRCASGCASTSTSTGGSTCRRSCSSGSWARRLDPQPLLAYLRGKLGEIYELDS